MGGQTWNVINQTGVQVAGGRKSVVGKEGETRRAYLDVAAAMGSRAARG
jgi:hypothetical protein